MSLTIGVNHYVWPAGRGLLAFLDAVARCGADAVALTAAALREMAVADIRRELEARGLAVTSVNSVGYFTEPDPVRRAAIDAASSRTIAATAELGARAVCVIAGGTSLVGESVADARARVADGLARLDEEARAAGVRLGLEPIHPSDIRSKGCVNSIAEARAMTAGLTATGLIVDFYHSWWDPDLVPQDAAALADRHVVQVCDVAEQGGRFVREVPGEGFIDPLGTLARLHALADVPFEFEMFPADLRGRDPAELMDVAVRRMRRAVAA